MLDYVALIQPYDCSEVTLPDYEIDHRCRPGPNLPVVLSVQLDLFDC